MAVDRDAVEMFQPQMDELKREIDDAQAGLTREERVAFLNDLAARVQ